MRRIVEVARGARHHLIVVRRDILLEPLNRGARWRLVSAYLRWHLAYKHRGKRWLVRFENGLQSWVYPHPDHDAGEVNIWTRNVDLHDERLIRRLLTSGDFIVDAGCNVGNRTWPLADVVGGALLIDAADDAIRRARENLHLNGLDERDFVLLAAAVGDREGEVLFTDLGGAHTLNRVVAEGESDVGVHRVPMTTIDRELDRLGRRAAFVKIDVEGHDLEALRGARGTLTSGSVKLVKFEHNQTEPLEPLLEFFRELGWVVFALDRHGVPTLDRRHIERNMNLFAWPGDGLQALPPAHGATAGGATAGERPTRIFGP